MDLLTDDYSLALQLQAQFDRENGFADYEANAFDLPPITDLTDSALVVEVQKPKGSQEKSAGKDAKIIDNSWELIDPTPDARSLFMDFNAKYFWGKLDGVEVKWSNRMTLCAGLCQYEGHGGLCSIRLSEPLLKFRPRKDLIETLLHEMIHAYLFVTNNDRDREGHGPEFLKHMHRLNSKTGSSITVYHNFNDEVDNCRQHWWRCDGSCRERKPFFGYVRRAMNRAPSKHDTWWAEHQLTCGGTFTKIKEPEGYGVKKKTAAGAEKGAAPMPPTKAEPKNALDRWITKDGILSTSTKANVKPTATATNSHSADVDLIDLDFDSIPDSDLVAALDITECKPSSLDAKLSPRIPGAQSDASIISFPGKGQALSKNPSPPKSDVPPVRRLPGFGVVTSGRIEAVKNELLPGVAAAKQESSSREQRLSDGSLSSDIGEFSQADRRHLKPSTSGVANGGKKRTKSDKRTIEEYLKGFGVASVPVGTVISVKNFMSVSNPKARPSMRSRLEVQAARKKLARELSEDESQEDDSRKPAKRPRSEEGEGSASSSATSISNDNKFLSRAGQTATKLLEAGSSSQTDSKFLLRSGEAASKLLQSVSIDDKKSATDDAERKKTGTKTDPVTILIHSDESQSMDDDIMDKFSRHDFVSTDHRLPTEPMPGTSNGRVVEQNGGPSDGSIWSFDVELVECPVCSVRVKSNEINDHLDHCLM